MELQWRIVYLYKSVEKVKRSKEVKIKFCSVRIRRAVLEAALRTRSDFHSALEQLEKWISGVEVSLTELDEVTTNIQTLKDFVKRKKWIEDEKVKVHIACSREVLVELNLIFFFFDL